MLKTVKLLIAYLITTSLLTLSLGCASKPTEPSPDASIPVLTVIVYKGHRYLLFTQQGTDKTTIVHDPDCPVEHGEV